MRVWKFNTLMAFTVQIDEYLEKMFTRKELFKILEDRVSR